MRKMILLALTVVMAAGASAFAADSDVKESIKIGLMGPMTGPWAQEGREMKQVLDLLAENINNAGGLIGRQIEIISEDDAGDPNTAVQAANRLVAKGVIGVIGTYGSSVTEAAQPVYHENEVIQIANASTVIQLGEKGFPYFFRTCPRDDEQGRVASETVKSKGFKNVAVLHDNTTFSKGLAEETRGILESWGLAIVFFDALNPGQKDYQDVISKIRDAKPDVLFFTGYYPEAGVLLRQKKEMGWDVPMIGGDGVNNVELVSIAGKDAVAGFYFISPPMPKDLADPRSHAFLEDYKEKFGAPPDSINAMLAGDGLRVLLEAIKETKSTDTKMVSDYLHDKLKNYPGFSGNIGFDEKGNRVGDVYRVYQVDEAGAFILQP